MNVNILKIATLSLILDVIFSSCLYKEAQIKKEEVSPCDPLYGSYKYGTPTWVYELIDEFLENGFYGRIYQCDYIYGYGFIIECFENGYSFRTCEGLTLYEGEEKNIEITYPELNISNKSIIMGKYPLWDNEEIYDDSYLCNISNPFTLHRVKEMIYRCNVHRCRKLVSITKYRDGVGFLLGEHINARQNWEFIDCSGNLLCNTNLLTMCNELCIDISEKQKIILELNISLNVN